MGEEEAAEKLVKAEVEDTFCGPLEDKQKDQCLEFYEELAEEEPKDPDEE